MRLGVALLVVFAAIAPVGISQAQDAPQRPAGKPPVSKQPAAPAAAAKGKKMVLLCPQQQNGKKVNVTCNDGEKCCYQPLFDTGECVPEGQGCMGVVNPLPRVAR